MFRDCTLPDFKAWNENAKEINGITVALEDFVVYRSFTMYGDEKDIFYIDASAFSWKKAKKIEKKILIPNGWRLPTAKEWTIIADFYGTNVAIKENLKLQTLDAWPIEANGDRDYTLYVGYWSAEEANRKNAYSLYLGDEYWWWYMRAPSMFTDVKPADIRPKCERKRIRCVAI